jgi:hypothetical protein
MLSVGTRYYALMNFTHGSLVRQAGNPACRPIYSERRQTQDGFFQTDVEQRHIMYGTKSMAMPELLRGIGADIDEASTKFRAQSR